jgi:hypothetical protein
MAFKLGLLQVGREHLSKLAKQRFKRLQWLQLLAQH